VLAIVLLDFDFLEGLFDPDDVQVVPVAAEAPLPPVMPDFFLCGSTTLSSDSDVLLGAMLL
jgi:hypothetical protein